MFIIHPHEQVAFSLTELKHNRLISFFFLFLIKFCLVLLRLIGFQLFECGN